MSQHVTIVNYADTALPVADTAVTQAPRVTQAVKNSYEEQQKEQQ